MTTCVRQCGTSAAPSTAPTGAGLTRPAPIPRLLPRPSPKAAGWRLWYRKSSAGLDWGLTEASIIMEEINRSGGNAGAVHGQMYTCRHCCGRVRRRRSGLPAGHRPRRTAPAIDGGDRTDHGHRHDEVEDRRGPQGRSLRRQRPEGLDLAAPAFGPDDPARAAPRRSTRSSASRMGCPCSSWMSLRRWRGA